MKEGREQSQCQGQREAVRCYIAVFEDGAREHKSKSAGGKKKKEKKSAGGLQAGKDKEIH